MVRYFLAAVIYTVIGEFFAAAARTNLPPPISDVGQFKVVKYLHRLSCCTVQTRLNTRMQGLQINTRNFVRLNLVKLEVHSVERIYLRQRCFDASKPRVAAAMGAQYGFSRRNKIPRCSA